MPTKRLNNKTIASITHPAKGQVLYWDDKDKGFGLRVTASTKTFIVQNRIKGRNCRVAIGRWGTYTVERARDEARDLLCLMAKGIDPNKAKAAERVQGIRLAEVYEEYTNSHDLRPKTLSVYRGALNRCFSDWLRKPIVEISKDMVERKYHNLCNANGPRGKGEAQAKQAMRLLGSLYNYALVTYETAEGKPLVTENPVRRLSQIKRGWSRVPRRQTVLLPKELAAFYAGVMQLRKDTARDFFLLLLLTGLRRNEASKLLWDEIDLPNKHLIIPPNRTKNKQAHGLPLTGFLYRMLKRRSEANVDGSPYVFPGRDTGSHYSEPKSSVQRVSERMGKKFMPHDLRRTFITIAEGLKIEHYALKRLLNHSNSSDVTLGYIITEIDRLREPMKEISAFMLKHMQVPEEEEEEDTELPLEPVIPAEVIGNVIPITGRVKRTTVEV